MSETIPENAREPNRPVVLRKLDDGESHSYTSTHKRDGTHDVYEFLATYAISDLSVDWTAKVSFLDDHKSIRGGFAVLSSNTRADVEQMVHELVCQRIDTGVF